MNKFSSVALTATLAVLVLGAGPASAAVVDQAAYVTPIDGVPMVASSIRLSNQGATGWQAQSVTAGVSGLLDRVDLQIWRIVGDADLVLTIGAGEVTDVGWAPFASVSLPYFEIPTIAQVNAGGYVTFDVGSLGFHQTAGQTFTLMLTIGASPVTNAYGWVFGQSLDGGETTINGVVYDGGVNRISTDKGATWSIAGYDRGFRTWVAGGVPEPATWAMLIIGFGAVGAAARRRRLLTA